MNNMWIIICISVNVLYATYLYYQYKNPFVDEIVDQGPIMNENNKRSGTWRL